MSDKDLHENEQESSNQRQEGALTFLGFTFALLVLFCVTYFLERRGAGPSEGWHYLLQAIAGSSWADWRPALGDEGFRSWKFATAAAWHVALNVLPAIAVAIIAWKLVAYRRREEVRFEQLLKLRDLSIKSAMERALSGAGAAELWSKLDKAFEDGSRLWAEKHLVTLLGREGAERTLGKAVRSGRPASRSAGVRRRSGH